jgi:Arylsulfotransferase (ASST)
VIPFPGTPDASPITQVIFSSLTPSELRSVNVTGSLSGRHSGQVQALPDGFGAAFVPDHPFVASETVRVHARLRSAAGGTASGAPGSRALTFSFGIGAQVTRPGPASTEPVPVTVGNSVTSVSAQPVAAPVGTAMTAPAAHTSAGAKSPPASHPAALPAARTDRSYPPAQHFHSMPGLGPPIVETAGNPDHASGDIFLTPGNGRQHGPTIINSRGQLVWFDHISNRTDVSNLEVKRYRGKPVLTWWQGKFAGGHGINGRDVIMSSSYRILKELKAGNGYSSDLHEFQVMPNGTAFVDCYVPVHANLSSQGGAVNGVVLDAVVQKLDIRTGRVLWEWHALGHVPVIDSYIGDRGGTYDYFHINSIEELPGDKVLVSARNTWAAYLIDERTGHIDWTLGGKHSDFRIGAGAGFQWQHHIVMHNGLMTVFDDATVPKYQPASSAKLLRVNTGARTVSLVTNYFHSPPLIATYMGSAQLLPNHGMFVGWGNTDNFSEYSAGGRQIFNGSFRGDINSYRAYRFQWHGQPRTPPAVAISPGPNGAVRVYSAWNGATQVARWRVLGGAAPGSLGGLGLAASRGFETGQWVHGEPRFFVLEGIDARGHVLGRSQAVPRPSSAAIYGQNAFVSASTGGGALPVACFTLHTRGCSLRVTMRTGNTDVARTSRQQFTANRGGLLRFRLSSAARRMLTSAHSHQMPVRVTAQDSSGHTVHRQLELIQFTSSGAGPTRTMTASPTIELLGATDFATTKGQGAILSACYAAIRCYPKGSLTAGGKTIATIAQHQLGANEVGYSPFQLTAAGRDMLARATGNQLAVQVRLSNGSDVAAGQVALVRYS